MKSMFTAMALCLALIAAPRLAVGADIQNYSHCDVCPGNIHYGPQDAKNVLPAQVLSFSGRFSADTHRTIKIDLDGVLKNGGQNDTNPGYDIELSYYDHMLYITDLHDGSFVLLITDFALAPQSAAFWHPEIYLFSGHDNPIKLTDSLPQAWERMKTSKIYRWIKGNGKDDQWTQAMGAKIVWALGLLSAKP